MHKSRLRLVVLPVVISMTMVGCGDSNSRQKNSSAAAPEPLASWGCKSTTSAREIFSDNRSLPASFQKIAKLSADHIASDKWKGGPPHSLTGNELRESVKFSPSGYRLGCNQGTVYLQTPGLDVPIEVCGQDMQGVFSTTDGSSWKIVGLSCAGDIGPICTDTPRVMREAWYPKPNPMWSSCNWK